jgi:type I restriction enzyme S subunit
MMNQCSHGATMASLNQDIIERIELPLPLLTIQRKITAILSAYDDLIENNLRRIKILEEMAQNLYREWFVKFRFPGYENAKMANDLPEGWEKVTLRDVTNYINRGISPNYAENTDRQVINQKCIRDNKLNLELARQHATQYGVDKAVRFGDVLVNSTGVGTLGRVAQVYDELTNYTVDSHVTIVRPNNTVQVDYFGLYLFGLQPYFDQMGVGATGQTELSRERIANAQFVLPPLALQEQFGYSVSPQRKLILNLQRRNQKLMETRDLLLPRLISGEVDVSGLDIAVPAEARA